MADEERRVEIGFGIGQVLSVKLGDEELNRLRPGEFFGEISTLLGDPLTADVIAETPLRVLEIPGPKLEAFLLTYPRVMYRILQTEARRLQEVLAWRA